MAVSSVPQLDAPAGTRRRLGWILALLALAQLIYALDLNIVFVALPAIGSELGFPGQTQVLADAWGEWLGTQWSGGSH